MVLGGRLFRLRLCHDGVLSFPVYRSKNSFPFSRPFWTRSFVKTTGRFLLCPSRARPLFRCVKRLAVFFSSSTEHFIWVSWFFFSPSFDIIGDSEHAPVLILSFFCCFLALFFFFFLSNDVQIARLTLPLAKRPPFRPFPFLCSWRRTASKRRFPLGVLPSSFPRAVRPRIFFFFLQLRVRRATAIRPVSFVCRHRPRTAFLADRRSRPPSPALEGQGPLSTNSVLSFFRMDSVLAFFMRNVA